MDIAAVNHIFLDNNAVFALSLEYVDLKLAGMSFIAWGGL